LPHPFLQDLGRPVRGIARGELEADIMEPVEAARRGVVTRFTTEELDPHRRLDTMKLG
jgi:hypothetical protein